MEAVDRLEQCYVTYAQAEQSRRAAVHAEGVTMSLFVEATSDLEKAQEMFSAQAQELENTKLIVTEAARTLIQWVKQHVSVLDVLRSGSVSELESIGKVASPAEILSLKSALLTAGVPLSVIPEPAQVLCQEIDQDVTRLIAARHEALLRAVQSLQAYSAALQQLVPVNYVSSSHVHSWAEVLQVSFCKLIWNIHMNVLYCYLKFEFVMNVKLLLRLISQLPTRSAHQHVEVTLIPTEIYG